MAEQSTAAVDVADNSGKQPLTAKAGKATADGAEAEKNDRGPARDAQRSELHSGHKLARRYRLEECVTRLEGFSSWRAVDEKLRRAVGVHLLPADHPRARSVLAAARSAALLGDPRFIQVLDAVEENDLVYVVHEWLPDATELTPLLTSGPLEPHEAYQLVSQVSQAMAAAHREGLSHLRLGPSSVLRTDTGQYRIRGLAVMASLRGITSDHPQRTDTEAIGALLYAALTQRWPYEGNAHGLSGLPKGVGLIAPDQVRAGVHRGLSQLAMRALVNNGATASRQEQPCTTPEELAKAVAAMPRIRPPESSFTSTPTYGRPNYQQGAYGPRSVQPAPVSPPPPLQSRTGTAIKWIVSSLLIAALGLGSWQLADTLLKHGEEDKTDHSQTTGGDDTTKKAGAKKISIKGAREYAPDGKPQHSDEVKLTYDGDGKTFWRSKSYTDQLAPGSFKEGFGIVYDLGSKRPLSSATVHLVYGGDHTTLTLYAADGLSPSTSVKGMEKLAARTVKGTKAEFTLKKPARYVLLWISAVPYSDTANYSGAGYKQAINEVEFRG